MNKTDEQWRAELTPEQYRVLRESGTEAPFTHPYNDTKEQGVFRCAACATELFRSDQKFDSGTGWPSFVAPADVDAVETRTDRSLFMKRTEVICKTCGGHLGHVFDDGPGPDGQRFCINGAALDLQKSE